MTWLTEDPTGVLWFAALLAAGGLVAVGFTRQGKWLGLVGVAAVLAIVALGIDALVTAPREQVALTLERLRGHLEAEDAALLNGFDLGDVDVKPLQAQAREILGRIEFERVVIRDLDINLSADAERAEAAFLVLIDFQDRRGEIPQRRTPLKLRVEFRRRGERWLVGAYEVRDLQGRHLMGGLPR